MSDVDQNDRADAEPAEADKQLVHLLDGEATFVAAFEFGVAIAGLPIETQHPPDVENIGGDLWNLRALFHHHRRDRFEARLVLPRHDAAQLLFGIRQNLGLQALERRGAIGKISLLPGRIARNGDQLRQARGDVVKVEHAQRLGREPRA